MCVCLCVGVCVCGCVGVGVCVGVCVGGVGWGLVIQHAMRKPRILLSSVACPAVRNFSTYLLNGTIFGRKLWNKMCVLFSVQFVSETFLILRRIK